jgi:hypothetical protein
VACGAAPVGEMGPTYDFSHLLSTRDLVRFELAGWKYVGVPLSGWHKCSRMRLEHSVPNTLRL